MPHSPKTQPLGEGGLRIISTEKFQGVESASVWCQFGAISQKFLGLNTQKRPKTLVWRRKNAMKFLCRESALIWCQFGAVSQKFPGLNMQKRPKTRVWC